jgi:glycosyltransferase involved in cell wall biosynthesis
LKEIILVSPKLGIGGIQRSMTNLANWFADNNYKVKLISCKNEEVFYDLNKKINLVVPSKVHPGTSGNLIRHYLHIILYLRNEFKKSNCKNIISFGDAFNPLVIIACLGLNKYVHISDRTSPDYNFKWHLKLLKKLTYRRSVTFIAQTSIAANWNKAKFDNKLNIVIIPNQVREVNIDIDARKDKTILYLGRFAWEKNPEALIRSFGNITYKNGWKLIMLGDGPLLNKLISLKKELKLENDIEFIGQVKNVDFYLSRASIYVLPSVLEGFPNALCEAMAFGLACICSSKIPYHDIGKNNVDFIVSNPDELQDMTTKIEMLMGNPKMRNFLGNNAKKINERLSLDAIGMKFESVLK